MAAFGLPGGAEFLILCYIFGFYAVMAVGFFIALYFAVAKGVARGIREGYGSIPPAAPQHSEADKRAYSQSPSN